MSRHGRAGGGGKKRKPQAVTARGSRDADKPAKKVKRTNDMYYEAMDSDPDEEKHADRYDHVDNYEYELPSDFEDEEIDEEMAFTAEDKKLYAGWFGDEEVDEQQQQDDDDGPGSGSEEDGGDARQRRSKRSKGLGEFADLESSSDEEQQEGEDGYDDDEGEVLFGDAEEYEGLENDHRAAAAAAMGGGSDDDEAAAAAGSSEDDAGGGSSDGSSEGDEDEEGDEDLDDERHRAMLQAVLGRQPGHAEAAAAAGKRRGLGAAARNAAVVAEAYPESEAHAGAGADGGSGGELRLSDLMAAATAATAASGPAAAAAASSLRSARKLLERLERQSAPLSVPLPRTVAERLERQAGYDDTKQEVTRWQPIVKANREAPTIRFTAARNEVAEAAASTAALVDGFTPNTDDPDGLEAQVAALLGAAGSLSAHAMAEADAALAPKKFTAEEAKERADRLSKMRHLLFYAELKSKRLSKIKSKEYHRRANKAARRAAARAGDAAGDEEEAARLAAEEAAFDRAKERLTLKHRNSSKWARRALKRGQVSMDPSTREAIASQLALGQQLRRRIEGKRGDSSGDEEGGSDGSTSASEPEGVDGEGPGRQGGGLMSSRSRKEALAILKGLADPTAGPDAAGTLAADGAAAAAGAGAGAAPAKKGLFALPFMVRALEKQRAAAAAQAAAMLADLGGEEAAAGDAAAAAALESFEEAAAGAGAGGAGSGRLQFSGTGPAVGGGRQQQQQQGADSLSGSDSEEDVDAKAERLQRHLAGEAAAAADTEAAVERAAAAQASKQQQQGKVQAGRQQQQQPARDVGYVEVQLPSVAAVCSKAGRAAANTAAAAAVNGGAHTNLFSGQQRKRKQGHAPAAGEGAEGDGPSTSQPAFVPAKVWQGPRAGYVFKRDKQGLGYYLDTQQQHSAAAAAGHKCGSKQKRPVAEQQQVLQRQQQAAAESSSDDEGAAAGQVQQQQQAAGAKGSKAANGTANGTAAAAVGAMQLLSSEADLNRQLLQAAFAGDDVEAAFASDKTAEVDAELPSAEVEGQLPGWGKWSNQQKEPAWMVAAKAKAAAQHASAAASRKDANLKHVVISEKWDKKAAKYLTPNLPFPFNDKQVYENAMRQPLGRQYNPDAAFRNLTRPAVLKTTGVVIEPARFSKAVEQYNASGTGKGRAVVTIAGGMQLEGQAAGTGAGGVGKGLAKKQKKQAKQQQAAKGGAGSSKKQKRLHEAAV